MRFIQIVPIRKWSLSFLRMPKCSDGLQDAYADRLGGRSDSAIGKRCLDVSKPDPEPLAETDCVIDDLGGTAVSVEVKFVGIRPTNPAVFGPS